MFPLQLQANEKQFWPNLRFDSRRFFCNIRYLSHYDFQDKSFKGKPLIPVGYKTSAFLFTYIKY